MADVPEKRRQGLPRARAAEKRAAQIAAKPAVGPIAQALTVRKEKGKWLHASDCDGEIGLS